LKTLKKLNHLCNVIEAETDEFLRFNSIMCWTCAVTAALVENYRNYLTQVVGRTTVFCDLLSFNYKCQWPGYWFLDLI